MSPPRRKGRSGGAATAAGVDLQARLAAWLACAILAETDAPPLWDWPEAATFESVYAETEEPTDDLLVQNSTGAVAYVQAKYRLECSARADSPLGSAIGQFVRQFRRRRSAAAESNDRLVLAVGPTSTAPVREHLPRILTRLRALSPAQSISSAAKNIAETKTLDTVLAHVRREWLQDAGAAPSDDDERALLRQLRVSIHDLYGDGSELYAAKLLLRQTVLKQSDQAGLVYDCLVSSAVSFSVDQTGANRVMLHNALARLGIELRAAPSFRGDVAKLIAHSTQTIQRLQRFASIIGAGGAPVTIHRTAPVALRRAVDQQSAVVTGDPGAGKSATLYEFARAAQGDGRDVVVLASDTLAAASLGQLRDELGLEHEVLDVLLNWPGVAPAFLVVDALDAARGEYTQQTLLDLIGSATAHAGRWRIAASIRRFDLRYSQDIQALFSGPHPAAEADFQSDEFAQLSHFNVPLLSDNELQQLEELAPALHTITDGASVGLRALLRVPFNLRLLADLTALGVTRAELAPIATQLQLLETYWQHRVLAGDGGDAREVVLRAACQAMAQARALRLDRALLQTEIAVAKPLAELLSDQVLAEDASEGVAQRYVITFAHHVLFDYAAARLLFRGTAHALLERTRADPDLLLVIRPSYELHFRWLWEQRGDRSPFWDLAIALAARAEVPAIGVIIAPGVASLLIESLADVRALVKEIGAADAADRRAAQSVLEHLVGARLAAGELGASIPADRRKVWADVAAAFATPLGIETAYVVRNLLVELCAKPDRFDIAQRETAGIAARALLGWSLDAPQYHRHLVRTGISAVARTFASDPSAADSALRLVLAPGRLTTHGYVEMPALAEQVPHLIAVAPGLVRDIYASAFSHEETSDEPTSMTEGVVALNSNRRQDYEIAHYALAQAFPEFLNAAPAEALEALSAVRLAFARRLSSRPLDHAPLIVPWRGSVTEIQPEGYFGDGSDHDDEAKILSAFGAWLTERASADREALRRAVDLVRAAARPASLWRRVLRIAADNPEPFVPLLEPLVTAPTVLCSPELGSQAGAFLHHGFGRFSAAARRRIEEAIMSLPDTFESPWLTDPTRAGELGEHSRDELLGRLDAGALVTTAARDRRAVLSATGALREARDYGEVEWTAEPSTSRDALAEQGVAVDAAPNRRLQDLRAPVETFVTDYPNGAPPDQALAAVEAPLRALWDALQSATADGADEGQTDSAWGHASAAAEAVARGKDLSVEWPIALLAREILLAAATHRLPMPSEELSRFDDFPHWGSPAPRVEAGRGLPVLAWHSGLATSELLREIERLSMDAVPAVRFQIAQRVGLLLRTAPETMWAIADRLLFEEPSTAVLNVLVRALPGMTLPDGQLDRLHQAIRAGFARAAGEGKGAADLRTTCVQLMTNLYVMRGSQDAAQFVDEVVVDGMKEHPQYAERVVHLLRDTLTHGDVESSPTAEEAIRRRAIGLAETLLRRAMATLRDHNQLLAGKTLAHNDPQLNVVRATAHVIDGVASEVYFATGLFQAGQGDQATVSVSQRERLYTEAASLLDELCDVAFAPSTHHVLETLAGLVAFDPRGAFLRIARTVTAGQAGGYQNDGMGAGLVVKLVEQYLAEHRTLLQQDDACRTALVDILDVFVRAGWPAALKLTYGLQDIFR